MTSDLDGLGPLSPQSQPSTSSAGPSSARNTPSRPLFPGFLSATDDANFDLDYSNPGSPFSSPKSGSLSGLPYLHDAESPIAGPSASPFGKKISPRNLLSPTVPSPHRGAGRHALPPLSPSKAAGSPGSKRRPSPLLLGKGKESKGLDEEIELQRDLESPLTAISGSSDDRNSLSNDLKDLSLLRHTIRQNLLARPVDSPLGDSDSDAGSSGYLTPDNTRSLPIPDEDTISVNDVLQRLRSSPQLLIIDTRPIGSFLEAHFPRSANISIPSLIYKRFKKANGTKPISWEAMGGFVSTSAGRGVWDSLEINKPIDVVVVGLTAADELAKVIQGTVRGLVKEKERVRILKGGWTAVMGSSEALEQIVTGENSTKGQPSLATSLPPPKSAPAYDFAPPPIPPSSPPRVSHHPSMPSLRTEGAKRNLPSLSIRVGGQAGGSKRPPKLSLNLDKSLRSATFGTFQHDLPPPTPGGSAHLLSVDHAPGAPRSPGFSLDIPKSARLNSFQTLCHAQSKLPPSPSSFGDVRRVIGQDEDVTMTSTRTPNTPWTSHPTVRPGISRSSSQNLTPGSPTSANSEAVTTTARNGLAPFIVSTILPSFLYLGPEISSEEDIEVLRGLGVKRILNVALECDDDAGLGLRDKFKYLRVPMRDIVEESGVAEGLRESCNFLDDARLHSAPTYVHCKVGKSRSVTVVLAYLIHANAWTLKTSYAYVAERRRGISPNIGFVAELMQFEEAELGLKQSGGVHGEGGAGSRKAANDVGENSAPQKSNPRYMRESLPPAWSHSVDSHLRPPKVSPVGERSDGDTEEEGKNKDRRQVGDEREVRKNGQWVHQRRAPVDRTTLQPGRRVSKAGLESLRPLNTTTSPRPSPTASPGVEGGAATPGGEGRLRWV